MPPQAYIVHQTRSRVRLRLAGMRNDPDFFEEISDRLAAIPGIAGFQTRSTTGCIILQHPERPWDELEPELRALGLFEITAPPETRGTALESLQSGLSRLDQAVAAGSEGRLDLRTLAYLGLMTLTITQAIRGQLLGPSIPLLFNAMSLIERLSSSDTGLTTDTLDSD
jgi:hypothetical protein